VSTVASLPEFRLDGVVNSVYMGDYNAAFATAGLSTSAGRSPEHLRAERDDPPNRTCSTQKVNLGLAPGDDDDAGGRLGRVSIPVDYVINFSDPVRPARWTRGDFRGGRRRPPTPSSSQHDAVTYHYNSAPFAAQGLHTMTMAAGGLPARTAARSGVHRHLPLRRGPAPGDLDNPPFPNGVDDVDRRRSPTT